VVDALVMAVCVGTRAPGGGPSDRGAIVVGWFTKIVVTLALLGTLLFDAIHIAEARAQVSTAANDAATAAQGSYEVTHNLSDATAAAAKAAALDGATVAPGGVAAAQVGRVVTLTVTVHITAPTTLLGHLPGTGALTQATAAAARQVTQ
jgi:hypothetical protein